ncbi:hypothetical protein RI054_43g152360 [Pseudoscourfieldia marina]
MARHCRLPLAFAFAFVVALSSSRTAHALLTLDDANFEHDTQASTGQTTGRWLVLAVSRANKELDIEWEDALSFETPRDDGLISAVVTCSTSPKTCKRLGVSDAGKNKLMLFRDQKLYVAENASQLAERDAVLAWATEGYKTASQRMNVPPEPSVLSETVEWVQGLLGKKRARAEL